MTMNLGLSPEQKAARRGKIGASNTAGILGISPWSSPIQEWAKIMEPSEDDIRTDAMTAGLLFESKIIEWYEMEHGKKVHPGWTMGHPDLPYIVATPDGLVRDEFHQCDIPLECKFVSARQAERWRDVDGLYRAPDYVRIQNVHQQIVMRVTRGIIVACIVAFEGVKFHAEAVTSTGEEQWQIMQTLAKFHDRYMATNTPPPADASARTTELLVKRHPKGNGTLLTASESDYALRMARQDLAEKAAELKRQIDEIDNQVRARIGDADGIEGLCRWSTREGAVSYAKACKAAGLDDEFLSKFKGSPTRVLKWEA